jgi:hypothetical protein
MKECTRTIRKATSGEGHAVAYLVEALCYKRESQAPEEVNVFNLPNPSSRTMALGSTRPLTEMSIGNLSGGKKLRAPKTDNLAVIYEPNV